MTEQKDGSIQTRRKVEGIQGTIVYNHISYEINYQ